MATRLDHVNMTVTNLDESIGWYQKLFGFERVEGGLNQYGKRWAIIACDDSMLALTEYEDKKVSSSFANHKIFHFGLRIENIDEWRAKVQQYDLKLYYGDEVQYPHSRSWYIHDPSGHEIEVSWADGGKLKF